ncbi:23S rRNA (uracil(1939)-C(5))-methyltransferase RlmD [Alloprevotella tannerae]|uniref:23S rRNA (Uracil(1939)-C(5))-methyltransferase RlmD n=1 Tax=Alloprevotella tannerae TaxID=76122 RepID=A0A929WY92_9BACT|nr:23S rRNA (uracil(1939)-C(5))-methyltransferase RlmD [Alloprevotella tannerae]MBF0971110.1 23S rRNA (uracil(1939)-C(5))-methyltransferase RlmD [Alloprevotella tannerae]
MARKRKPLPLLENIQIEGIAAEGKAIARVDNKVIFIPYAVPGDIVDLQVTRKKSHYAEATIASIIQPSPMRIQPFCKHFGVCGGCKWQSLPYEEQLKAKQQQVEDALTRIGKVPFPKILPIIGSKKTKAYRNKLEFGFSNKKWLTKEQIESGVVFSDMNAVGFHIPGAFDKILDLKECFLMDDFNNRIRNGLRSYVIEKGYSFFDLRNQTGLLRNMMLRKTSTGEIMVLLQFCIREAQEEKEAQDVLQWIKTTFPEITSLLYVNNTKCNDTISDLDIHTFSGADYIYEQMEDLQFKIGPKSFYQTNSEQAFALYKVVREFANLSGNEYVYDLYTGTGTIANFIAGKAKRVIGIEYVPEAIKDAKENAVLNNLDNIQFFAGDMKDILTDNFVALYGRPDVIITDPPRAGMHNDVISTILFAAPKRIVYVSCNPATQARDVSLLSADYHITKVQPVDMFPQTHHVENVLLMERNN